MSTAIPTSHPLRAVPRFSAGHPGIQIGTYVSSGASDEELQFLQQLGVGWAMLTLEDPEQHTAAHYKQFKERFARFEIQIYRIANSSVHNVEEITLNLPDRDAKIEEFCTFMRNLGEAGIPYNTYAHMGNGIWSTGQTTGRGGVTARTLDVLDARGHWNGKRFSGELTHGRPYSEEEIWDNYAYFIRQIAPVAEENNVKIGIHPDDPPVAELAGIPRCFYSFDSYKRALEIADSPNIGICLCVGCWLEGGKGMGKDVFEAIRYFGAQKKLFKVHFRTVNRPLPSFVETYVDDGYTDMYKVLKALMEADFDGVIIPDHVPSMEGGANVGMAYTIGYMKAMVVRASQEIAAG